MLSIRIISTLRRHPEKEHFDVKIDGDDKCNEIKIICINFLPCYTIIIVFVYV